MEVLEEKKETKKFLERDLFWLKASTPLLRNSSFPFLVSDETCQSYFKKLEDDCTRMRVLDEFDSPILWKLSLGRYFEKLLLSVLRHHDDVSEIHNNIHVGDGKRTLGELDFVYRNTAGQVVHLEVAFKYYLQAGNSLADFVGPLTRDTLARKIHHLAEKQIPVVETKEAQGKLQHLFSNFDGRVRSEVLLLGMLFYWGPPHKPATLHSETHPDHRKGWWLKCSELGEHLNPSSIWCVHNRRGWQTGCRFAFHSELQVLNTSSLQKNAETHFSKEKHGLLVSEVIATEDGTLSELSRGFVVPDEWPRL